MIFLKKVFKSFIIIFIFINTIFLAVSASAYNTERAPLHDPFVINDGSARKILNNGWTAIDKINIDDNFNWAPGYVKGWKHKLKAGYVTIHCCVTRYFDYIEGTEWTRSQMEGLLDKWKANSNFKQKPDIQFGFPGVFFHYLDKQNRDLFYKYDPYEIVATIPAKGSTQISKLNPNTETENYIYIQPYYTNLYFLIVTYPKSEKDYVENKLKLQTILSGLKLDWKKIPEDPISKKKVPPGEYEYNSAASNQSEIHAGCMEYNQKKYPAWSDRSSSYTHSSNQAPTPHVKSSTGKKEDDGRASFLSWPWFKSKKSEPGSGSYENQIQNQKDYLIIKVSKLNGIYEYSKQLTIDELIRLIKSK